MRASLLLAALLSLQGAPRTYVSEACGLRLQAPDEAWTFFPEPNPGLKVLLRVTLFVKGTPGVPSVTVYVGDAGSTTDAATAREAAALALAAQGATEIERGTGKIAGVEAPLLRAKLKSPAGGPLAVRCLHRIEHGLVYSFVCARATDDPAADEKLDLALASAEFPEPKREVESAERRSWRELEAKCAGDLPWAGSWSEASKRAQSEGRLVLVLFRNYAPLVLPDTTRTGALLDPDFASLVAERFVLLRMGPEDDAPFRDPKVFGLGKHSFGAAFLFVEPDGRVAAECGIADASFVDEFARGVLAGRKPGAALPAGSALDRARALFGRGDLAAARKAIGDAGSAEAHRLRAAICRRERKGAEAIEELHAAKRLASPELEPELAADEAVILMRTRRYDEAEALFRRVAERWPESGRAREAEFWLGAFDVLRATADPAAARWRKLVEAHPESPWAWRAAADLLGDGGFAAGSERLDWPEPDLVECARKPAPAPLADSEAARAEREAVQWLVAHQKDDGSWWNPMDGFSVGSTLYTPACSAIACTALLAHLEAKGARAGAEKALAWALAMHRDGKLRTGEDLAGVYSIWNRTFVAWACARALRAKVGDPKATAEAMQALVDSVVSSQDSRGGWPYVHLPGSESGDGIDPSASFLTAGVLLALLDAREAGAKVPDACVERALAFLERLREPDGTFRYLPDLPGAVVDGLHPEACGRGPVCALALRKGGRGDAELLAGTLDHFLAHRGEFKAEWGKELCHTSPEGFGAHYLFYDYLFAARAVRELPREKREKVRGPLRADVLASRLADGSFRDLPGLGRPYATAMAALALAELAAE